MSAFLLVFGRFLLDFAGIVVGWTSLDLLTDWLFGVPIALADWPRYLMPTLAAALAVSLLRSSRARPIAALDPRRNPYFGAGFRIDWVDLIAPLAAYEAAARLPPAMRWLEPGWARVAATVALAVALGLAAAYVLHRFVAYIERRRSSPTLRGPIHGRQPRAKASRPPGPAHRAR